MTPPPATILIVDDRLELAENIAEILSGEGYSTEVVDSAESAMERALHGGFDALITDFRLPGKSGAQLIEELSRMGASVPAIVMSAYTDPATIENAQSAGAICFVPKPVDVPKMLGCLERALHGDGDGTPHLHV